MTIERDDPRAKNEYSSSGDMKESLLQYSRKIPDAFSKMDGGNFTKAFVFLEEVISRSGRVYVAGNGGSAAISDHLCCDWMKGTYFKSLPTLRTHSLSCSTALVTALANDFGYEFIFERQLEMLLEKKDLVILISSSGNSPNILKAAEFALDMGVPVIGMTGFSGGKLKEISTVSLHVPINNYGLVEDAHQMMMHCFGQSLIQKREKENERK